MSVTPPVAPPISIEQTQAAAPGIPVPVDATAGDDLAWALLKLAAKRPTYAVLRDYHEGRHCLAFSTEGYRKAFANMVQRLRANACPAVVSAFADKLSLEGFEPHAGMATGDDDAVAEDNSEADKAWALWEDEDLTLIADQIHEESPMLGDSYLIVWPDEEGRAAFYVNDPADVCVRYNVERKDRIDVAAKIWREGKRFRANLYYPDRIEKFQTTTNTNSDALPTSAKAFARYSDPGDAAADEGGTVYHDYGTVPVFHFPANAGQGRDGISDLADVIPIQDALNKSLADLIVAEEFGAYAQRWATGVEGEKTFNETTGQFEEKPVTTNAGIDRIVTVANTGAKFGQFMPTDLDKFVGVVNAHFSIIGKIKGIPAHYFFMVTGDFPSGEAQRTAEGRLVKRVERLQRRYGAVWARAMAFALLINGDGDGKLAFRAKWRTAEPRAASEQVTNFKMATDAGMPMETAAEQFLDWPRELVETMLAVKEEADKAATAAAQEAFSLSMDRGVPPTGRPKPRATLPTK